MENQDRTLHTLDFVVFAVILSISLAIGVYHAFTGDKQRTTRDYFVGNRKLKPLPVALSMLLSYISGILVLGLPAEIYVRGPQLVLRVVGYCFSCVAASVIFVPMFYNLQVTSCFEYLEKRYRSKAVRFLAAVMMIIGCTFYMGLLLYTPSTSLEAVCGFPMWASVIACGIVCTIYTTVGGMRAVVWTDVFQAVIMAGGMLAIIIQGSIAVGGLGKVMTISQQNGRMSFFNFNPDPTQRLSIWSLVIGGFFQNLSIFGLGQSSVQRYCSVPTLKQARLSLLLNIPGLIIVNILASLVGFVVFAYYTSIDCDPLGRRYISNSNQLVPYFIMDVLSFPGFPGIFLAVLYCGALSSVSSSLNSIAAVTWEDVILYLRPSLHEASEESKTYLTKFLVIVYGVIAICVSFGTAGFGVHVLQAAMSFSGATSGPTLGMFILGALFPFANVKGAMSGCLVAIGVSLWIAIGSFIKRSTRRGVLAATVAGSCTNTTSTNFTTILNGWHENGSDNLTYHHVDIFTTPASTNTSLNSLFATDSQSISGISRIYDLSFLWYTLLAVIITVIIGLIVSLATGGEDRELEPGLVYRFCSTKSADKRYSISDKIQAAEDNKNPLCTQSTQNVNIQNGQHTGLENTRV